MNDFPDKDLPDPNASPQDLDPLPKKRKDYDDEPTAAAPAPWAVPQKRPPKLFQKGNRVTRSFKQARQFLLGSKVASPVEESLRKQLLPFTTQAMMTKNFIEQNLSTLTDLSQSNEQVADLLKHLQESKYQKAIDEINRKLMAGEEVFAEDMKEIVSYFDGIAESFDNVGVQLESSLPLIIKGYQGILTNNQMDLNYRRQALDSLVKILDKQKIQNETANQLRAIAKSQLNFSEEQVNQISTLTDDLLSDKELSDKKMFGTFDELNKKLGGILFNVKEWRDFSEKEEEGKSVREHLNHGLGALPRRVKEGLMDTLFAAIGLPGLGMLFRDVGIPGISTFVSAIGGIIKWVPGLFESSGLLSKAITLAMDGFTEILAPLVVIGSALYGAYEGIKYTIEDWKKLGEGLVDFGKSLYHSLGGIIDSFAKTSPILAKGVDGIEFVVKNILDLPLMILKMISEGWKNIFGWLGTGAGKLGGILEGWSKGLDAPGGALPSQAGRTGATAVTQQVATAMNPPQVGSSPSPTQKAEGMTTEGFHPLESVKSFFGYSPAPTPVKDQAMEMNTQAKTLLTQERTDNQKLTQKLVENTQKPIIVQAPSQPPPPAPSTRKNSVDDLSTALSSLGLAGY